MRIGLPGLLLVFVLFSTASKAADISGTWQTDAPGDGMTISGSAKTGWRGEWFGDGTHTENPVAVTFKDQTIILSLLHSAGRFTGTLTQGGQAITGSWTQRPGASLTLHHILPNDARPIDSSPHKVRFVAVAPGVKLEVLDWGGHGPPLVFLAGLGNTAHNFDSFAPRFTDSHHVYAITRRGYGASSAPAPTDTNYDSNRLADDVLAVLKILHIKKPVLAGHSIAGEELSSIGTRHPEKVAALVYLEAGYGYAFYDPSTVMGGNVTEAVVRRDLEQLPTAQPSRARALVAEVQAALPALVLDMRWKAAVLKDPNASPQQQDVVAQKIIANAHSYSVIKVPILLFYADPPRCAPRCDTAFAKAMARAVERQVAFVEAQNPAARVVLLPHAAHDIYRSNQAQVEQDMKAFMDGLR